VSFADCYHIALAADLEFTEIYSFDKWMDRYPSISRIEP
jgi:predicted nucleic acid-binding protein